VKRRITVTPGGRYFQVEDGQGGAESFFPSGHNFLTAAKDDQDLRLAAELGENVIRIWPDAGLSGKYDVERLGLIFDGAARHGLWVLLTIFDAGPLTDLYSGRCRFLASKDTMFNGLCSRPEEVFTNPKAMTLFKERLGEFLDRWGDRDNIFGWEFNQMDGVYTVAEERVTAWVEDVIAFIKNYEEKRWGVTRPCGVSSFDPFPTWDLFYNGAGVDFLAGHAYTDSVKSPLNSVDGALHTAVGCRYALTRSRRPKPYLDTESGPMAHVFDWILPRPPQSLMDELYGNMIWAHVAAGGAGHSMFIPVSDQLRHPTSDRRGSAIANRLSPGQAERLKVLLAQVAGTDWRAFDPVDAAATGEISAGDWGGWVLATRDRRTGLTFGYLLQDTRLSDAAAVVRAALDEKGPCGPEDYNRRLFSLDVWMGFVRQANLELTSFFTHEQLGVIVRASREDNHIYPYACVKVDEILAKMKAVTRWDASLANLVQAESGQVAPSLRFSGYPAARFEVSWVDPAGGQILRADQVNGPDMTLTAPRFGRSLAFKVSPV